MSTGRQNAFYKTKAWQHCRASYMSEVGGLCENCLRKGIYRPAEIVHHKIHLDKEKIDDPTIALNHSNLEALCRDCHAEQHDRNNKRYKLDELGRVIFRDEPTESINHCSNIQRGTVSG